MLETSDWTAQDLAEFMECVRKELGIKMPGNKTLMLQSRILRRLRELNLGTLEEYRQRLFNSLDADEERVHFLDLVTTNHTGFFREPQHFDYLRQMASHRPGWFVVWSAGCSSGEEPYTIAMVLAEAQQAQPGLDFGILASDVSTTVIQHAAKGIYPQDRVTTVPQELRRKYLLQSKDRAKGLVRIVPELRERITFFRMNFMDRAYPVNERCDAVFFRNVMIYFDKVTQETVVNRLCKHLKPGAVFFCGHSESLAGLDVPLELVAPAAYRKIS